MCYRQCDGEDQGRHDESAMCYQLVERTDVVIRLFVTDNVVETTDAVTRLLKLVPTMW